MQYLGSVLSVGHRIVYFYIWMVKINYVNLVKLLETLKKKKKVFTSVIIFWFYLNWLAICSKTNLKREAK